MDEIKITITRNTKYDSAKKVCKFNKKETTFKNLLEIIAKKLEMDEVKILFNENGAQVEDINEINDHETLYASEGEKFLPHNLVAGAVQKSEEKIKILKLGIIGPPAVGKSALTVRYTQKVFIDEYLPSFEDIYKKNLMIEAEQVEVDILDSSGLDELVVMRPGWFKERDAFVMVYAIDSRASLEALKMFYEQLVTFRSSSNVPITVVGNKADLEASRVVKFEEGLKLAKQFNAEFIEASAKKDMNVAQVFENLAKRLFHLKFKTSHPIPGEGKGCCLIV